MRLLGLLLLVAFLPVLVPLAVVALLVLLLAAPWIGVLVLARWAVDSVARTGRERSRSR
jgi:hypothetical protein